VTAGPRATVAHVHVRPRTATVLAVLAAAWCTALASATPATAAETACPATFAVLNDDAIGTVQVPAGNYALTLLDDATLDCTAASDLFRQFLEDFDGRLSRPWVAKGDPITFTAGAGSTTGFRATPVAAPSGGGGGGRHPATGAACPAFFDVEHADRIGTFRVPQGEYRITLLATGRLTCARAATLFSRFLRDFDGRLSGGWRLDRTTGTFARSAQVGFRVKEAVGGPVTSEPAGTDAAEGIRCPGTFTVQHFNRIGKLKLPAGDYILSRLRGGKLTCEQAMTRFRDFLEFPMGDLPKPWVLNASEATFRRGRGSKTGFSVEAAT
jgi:hypothetical protein